VKEEEELKAAFLIRVKNSQKVLKKQLGKNPSKEELKNNSLLQNFKKYGKLEDKTDEEAYEIVMISLYWEDVIIEGTT